ncbi:septum formation family protein [Microbacterium sp. YY-03]|uniref:septum formation family protein n=1 Tax=Microbacterium sp. YY-03 TaxID=3421636 RepID=UPI003D16FCED
MTNSTIARRSLAAGAALALALSLGGCSAVQNIFGGGSDVPRDDDGQVTEQGTGSAYDLEVGDCLNFPAADEFSDVELVPCGDAHDSEVILNFESALAEFNEEEMYAEADEQCATEFQSYVGLDWETSIFDYTYFTPLEAGWEDGDRVITCVAYQADATDGSLVQTTGSVQGRAE